MFVDIKIVLNKLAIWTTLSAGKGSLLYTLLPNTRSEVEGTVEQKQTDQCQAHSHNPRGMKDGDGGIPGHTDQDHFPRAIQLVAVLSSR